MPATVTVHPRVNVAGRKSNYFGVGEVVDLRCAGANTAVRWEFIYGALHDVHLSQNADGTKATVIFTAPKNHIVQLRLVRADNGQKVAVTPRLQVVVPSDWGYAKPYRKGHKHGTASAGFWAMMVLKNPHHVSFGNLEVWEGTVGPAATGYLAFKHGDHHPQGERHRVRSFSPDGQTVPDGWDGFAFDKVSSGAYGTHHLNPVGDHRPYRDGGTFTWRIPWYFRAKGSANDAAGHLNQFTGIDATAKTMVHREVLNRNGKVTVSKGGRKHAAGVNDPDSEVGQFWP